MPRYQFTGPTEEVFPTIVTADGVLVAQPGESYDLDEVDHPRLVIEGSAPPVGESEVVTLLHDDQIIPATETQES